MIPERDPGERADQYLHRLNEYEKIQQKALKEAQRAENRINSEVERILIERAVKEALRPPVRPRGIDPRSTRWYKLPARLESLGPLAPFYILISIVWQNITKTDNRYKRGITLSRADPGGDNDQK
jgi:hypothetical protein